MVLAKEAGEQGNGVILGRGEAERYEREREREKERGGGKSGS